MSRKSAFLEEKARDSLIRFLHSLKQAPLGVLLDLYFNGSVPDDLADLEHVSIQKEVPTNLGSRADLVITGRSTTVCIEVKIDAVEQVGQYTKYKVFFGRGGSDVYVFGLIKHRRKSRTKDNEAFLKINGVRRLFWGELLGRFEIEFQGERAFIQFRDELLSLDDSVDAVPQSCPVSQPSNYSVATLASDNGALNYMFGRLLERMPDFTGEPWQYGNAPYTLMMGKSDWARKFEESWFHRIHLGFNKPPRSEEPCFGFCVVLWNRTWCHNTEFFNRNRIAVAEHFEACGFQIVRNKGKGWHKNIEWKNPYHDIVGLKYANAFCGRQFALPQSIYQKMSWEQIESKLVQDALKIARLIDCLSVGFEGALMSRS